MGYFPGPTTPGPSCPRVDGPEILLRLTPTLGLRRNSPAGQFGLSPRCPPVLAGRKPPEHLPHPVPCTEPCALRRISTNSFRRSLMVTPPSRFHPAFSSSRLLVPVHHRETPAIAINSTNQPPHTPQYRRPLMFKFVYKRALKSFERQI